VQRDSFAQTYEKVDIGKYRERTPIWAEVATHPGQVRTKEGLRAYEPGDYLVSNDEEGRDQYAIARQRFDEMYEPADE
jgi:hypothetical protein